MLVVKVHNELNVNCYYKFTVVYETLHKAEIVIARFLAYYFNVRRVELMYLDDLVYNVVVGDEIIAKIEIDFE